MHVLCNDLKRFSWLVGGNGFAVRLGSRFWVLGGYSERERCSGMFPLAEERNGERRKEGKRERGKISWRWSDPGRLFPRYGAEVGSRKCW